MLVYILFALFIAQGSFTVILPPRRDVNGIEKAIIFHPASAIH